MKLLMLILAFGLSVAYSQDIGNDIVDSVDTQDFMDHVLEDGFEEDEIVDMDDALEKARMLKAMAKMVAQAEAMDLMNPKKRFIGGFFDTIKGAIAGAAKKVGNFFQGTWNKAKNAFSAIIPNIDFSAVVNKVIPYINSAMTVDGCKKAIATAATHILGSFASVASYVSGHLCNAALARLQNLIG